MTTGVVHIGKALIVMGAALVLVGGLLVLSGKAPFIGRLPGDILIERKNYTFYFPLATSILISIIVSLVLWFIGRGK